MPEKKLVVGFKFFCFICKCHFTFAGENENDAHKNFHKCGHSDAKTARLKKGLVGV